MHMYGIGFAPSKRVMSPVCEKRLSELSVRGYRVGTVEHHYVHFPIEMDREGNDSRRYREAGAWAVTVVSPFEVALLQDTDGATP